MRKFSLILKPFIFFIFISIYSCSLIAQEKKANVISGVIRNEKGLPAADVKILIYFGTNLHAELIADSAGTFSIPIEKDGNYSFEFSLPGYITQQKGPYEVKKENGILILVDLKPQNVQIETNKPIILKGVVLASNNNAPVGGVSITINDKSALDGTQTNTEGAYSISAPLSAKIYFSHVNYETIEMTVRPDNLNDFRVVNMVPKSKEMDEVVVVAYGTQKKESVVSAITTIKPMELKVPASNLTTSFAGRVPGIISYQRSGEPGRDGAEFFIRGLTSFGTSGLRTPLILIDNVEMTIRDLSLLQPDDIASFSIMKDASAAALYGARGANGVVLITTKKGVEGKPTLSFRVENSFSKATRDLEVADPITFMKLHNEAVRTRNPLQPLPYAQSQIDNLVYNVNPYAYPSVNWREMLMRPYSINQRYNFNLSGGGKVATYYLSAGYSRDNGILKVDKKNNFNNNVQSNVFQVRTNVDLIVTKTTKVRILVNGTFDEYTGPLNGGAAVFKQTLTANPVLFPAYFPADSLHRYTKHILFGNGPDGTYLNPYAEMVKGYQNSSRTNILSQLELHQDLKSVTKGLRARALFNTTRTSFFNLTRQYTPYWYVVDSLDKTTGNIKLKNVNPNNGREYLDFIPGNKDISTAFYFESAVNYDRSFNMHSVGGMLVYYMRSSINANQTDLLQSLPFRNLGVSGRVTYNYDKRYFAEWNFGYNGSERFDVNNRFGFFPSLGLSWIASNEKFFSKIDFFKTLKIRATYGLNGSDAIGSAGDRFFYLSNVNLDGGVGPGFGLDFNFPVGRQRVVINRYANPNITWELARKLDVGLEVSLRNGVNIVAEYFREDRDNILMNRSYITPEMGLEATPRANVGKAYSQGYELAVDYQYLFNSGFTLTGRGNFTYAAGKYKKYEEPEYAEPWLKATGQPLGQQWGYIAERLFIDQEDIDNSPRQFGEYLPGDIKYADINKDGVIDSRDVVPIGYPTTPQVIYGFGLSATYKNFDISAFIQGSARSSFWIDRVATAPFIDTDGGPISNNALLKVYENSHWSEGNQDPYAIWPRLAPSLITNNNQQSTWFMQNGSFMRLKNAEIGYTLPRKIMERFFIANMRAYINGSNLAVIYSKFKLWDPEMAGNGLGYPVQRVFNVGLQVSFK